jgi:hypothetical protein
MAQEAEDGLQKRNTVDLGIVCPMAIEGDEARFAKPCCSVVRVFEK